MIEMPLCRVCKRLKDFELGEYERVIAHCEAYPNGIPEAVFYAGHIYAKPNDNGLHFEPLESTFYDMFLKKTEGKENNEYKELQEYFSELDMSDEEWIEKQMKELEIPKEEAQSLLPARMRRETELKIW